MNLCDSVPPVPVYLCTEGLVYPSTVIDVPLNPSISLFLYHVPVFLYPSNSVRTHLPIQPPYPHTDCTGLLPPTNQFGLCTALAVRPADRFITLVQVYGRRSCTSF